MSDSLFAVSHFGGASAHVAFSDEESHSPSEGRSVFGHHLRAENIRSILKRTHGAAPDLAASHHVSLSQEVPSPEALNGLSLDREIQAAEEALEEFESDEDQYNPAPISSNHLVAHLNVDDVNAAIAANNLPGVKGVARSPIVLGADIGAKPRTKHNVKISQPGLKFYSTIGQRAIAKRQAAIRADAPRAPKVEKTEERQLRLLTDAADKDYLSYVDMSREAAGIRFAPTEKIVLFKERVGVNEGGIVSARGEAFKLMDGVALIPSVTRSRVIERL